MAREALVDALAGDATALLAVLDGREVGVELAQAATLLATVVGQDLDEGADGVFRIARRVAPDRVISTVDPQARHGHKTSARGFDGYKGHIAIDPDSEIITATEVTAGNSGDAGAAADLLAADIPAGDAEPSDGVAEPRLAVYGDAAYGSGELLAQLEAADVTVMVKVQPPVAPAGHFAKDQFRIDLTAGTVTCPAGTTVLLRAAACGGGTASFGRACTGCPLAAQCTSSSAGRTISVTRYEAELVRARAIQTDPAWKDDDRATRPKVERKIGHLMRRRHGGRRARVRGRTKVGADFALLAAAVNLARLAVLGLLGRSGRGWAVAPA